jgi:hypothetical protein
MDFGADPEAGLDAEQRALIGRNDRKVVVVCPPWPGAPREIEVMSFNRPVVSFLSGLSMDDLYSQSGEIG